MSGIEVGDRRRGEVVAWLHGLGEVIGRSEVTWWRIATSSVFSSALQVHLQRHLVCPFPEPFGVSLEQMSCCLLANPDAQAKSPVLIDTLPLLYAQKHVHLLPVP